MMTSEKVQKSITYLISACNKKGAKRTKTHNVAKKILTKLTKKTT